MRWFRDRQVITKLLLGFGLVAAAVAAVGLFGTRGILRTRDNMRVVYSDYTVAGTDMARVSNALMRYRNNVILGLAAQDRATFDRFRAEQPGLKKEIQGSLTAYAATILRVSKSGRSEQQDLDAARKALDEYLVAAELSFSIGEEAWAERDPAKAEAARDRGKANAAHNAGPKLNATLVALDGLILTIREVAKDIHDESQEEAAAALRNMAAGTLAAALAALFLGLGIGRAITRPLARTVAVLEGVAKGDLSQRAEVDGRDELARLAAALNTAIANQQAANDKNLDCVRQLEAVSRAQAVIEFQPDGTVVSANDNFLTVTGYSAAEVVGRHHSLFMDPAEAGTPAYRELWAKLGRGEYQVGQFRRVAKGGREVWIHGGYFPIANAAGKVQKVVKFAFDITEAKRLEREAQTAAELQVREAEELRRKVEAVNGVVAALAAGDFTQRLPDLGDDLVGTMAAGLGQAVGTVRAALEGVRGVSEQLADASGQLASAGEEIASGAQEQASSLEETASTLEEITATVRQNSDAAQQARQLASGSRDVAEKGGQVVGTAVGAMGEINHASKKIADIITTIDEIAFQTNLLALNAAVEAARAG
ncbi:PAS domain S-box protein, partial [bacterium]|nr:PAS domain S-box protein [bacterium]